LNFEKELKSIVWGKELQLWSPGEDMAVNISYLVYSRYYLEYTR